LLRTRIRRLSNVIGMRSSRIRHDRTPEIVLL